MRSLWSGALSFGLINIPVKLYSAAKDRSISFKLFDKHGNCPVSYVRICRSNHKEVPYEDIVKGYEYQKGDYVVLDDKDFEKASPKKTDQIEIIQFSNWKEIEPMYYEKPYYIEPDKKSVKAYTLLRDALTKSKKVAIARFIMREKEHIAAIVPDGEILVLHQLRYQDEIRQNRDIDVPKTSAHSKSEEDMALALVTQLTKKFDPSKFHDTYTEELEKIIRAKAKGKTIKGPMKSPYAKTTEMKDLMKLLKESLNEGGESKPRKRNAAKSKKVQ